MTRIADYFASSLDRFVDPRLAEWEVLLHSGARMELEMNYWRPGPMNLDREEPFLQIHIDAGAEIRTEFYEWDDVLNTGLIELKVKAQDARQEGTRFAFGLRGAFDRPTAEFGNGYFNAVLLDYLRASEFAQDETIRVIVDNAAAILIDTQSQKQQFERCSEMIDMAIRGRALELTRKLEYSVEEAQTILIAALTEFLSRRFSRATLKNGLGAL